MHSMTLVSNEGYKYRGKMFKKTRMKLDIPIRYPYPDVYNASTFKELRNAVLAISY